MRAFHNLNADWGDSFAPSTRHFLDVLAGREPQEVLNAREGRRVIALYDLFQRSNAERRALSGQKSGSNRPLHGFRRLGRALGQDDASATRSAAKRHTRMPITRALAARLTLLAVPPCHSAMSGWFVRRRPSAQRPDTTIRLSACAKAMWPQPARPSSLSSTNPASRTFSFRLRQLWSVRAHAVRMRPPLSKARLR